MYRVDNLVGARESPYVLLALIYDLRTSDLLLTEGEADSDQLLVPDPILMNGNSEDLCNFDYRVRDGVPVVCALITLYASF